MRTIVVGIGNLILGDDGIGIHIVRSVQKHRQTRDDVTFDEVQTGGMNLLDVIRGYDKAILIDAVSFSEVDHGRVRRFHISDLPTVHSNNPHDVSFPDALLLAEKIGDPDIPDDITIIGVNLGQVPMEFTEELSPHIKECIPTAVSMVLDELQNDSMIDNEK